MSIADISISQGINKFPKKNRAERIGRGLHVRGLQQLDTQMLAYQNSESEQLTSEYSDILIIYQKLFHARYN